MKFFIYLFFGFSLVFPSFFQASADQSRMCYFQLTSASRSGRSGDEAKDLQGTFKLKGSDALISYFGSEKSGMTETAFKDMVSDGKKCNVLVLSGYHTGDFYADNPERGPLDLTLIEKLSCDPKYKEWFENVEGIVLHGSRTENDNYITGVRDNPESATPNKGDSDSITKKLVGDKGVTEEASRTVRDVNYSYAHTLDEYNPLSSRHMRGFPNAHIYAFSENAGVGAGDKDLKEHIAKVMGALGEDNKIKEDVKNAGKFVEALSKITADECDGTKWKGSGKEFIHRKKGDEFEKAKDIGCKLINAKQVLSGEKSGDKEKAKTDIKAALKEIVKNKKLSHLLINNVTETLQLVEKKMDDKDFLNDMKGILKGGKFKSALEEKIKSPIFPSLRKIDYIQFYKELGGNTDNAVRSLYQRVTGASDQTTNNKKTLYILMADKLSQYGLLEQSQIEMIRKNGALFPDSGTDWQKNMKIKLTYRSYANGKNPNHEFLKNLQENTNNPDHISVVTAEALRNRDLETAFRVAGAVAPESYFGNLSGSNAKFMWRFKNHIEGAPSPEVRSKMIDEYLTNSKAQDNDPNIKGKTNFQANLLRALYEMKESEFLVFFPQSKKDFFKSLDGDQKQNLNGQAKGVFNSIKGALGI